MLTYKNLGLLLVALYLVYPVPGIASPLVNEPTTPYEVMDVDARIENEQIYLGDLKGEPHSFEFSIGETKKFQATLMQLDEDSPAIPFSLILVRVNDNNRGVKEIGRVKGDDAKWIKQSDSVLGLNFYSSEPITYELKTGIYRFEISTSKNEGKYLLKLGHVPIQSGYFEALDDIRLVQNFFGFSFFRIFMSAYVYYPIGIMTLIVLLWFTWRYHQKIKHA